MIAESIEFDRYFIAVTPLMAQQHQNAKVSSQLNIAMTVMSVRTGSLAVNCVVMFEYRS